MQPAWPEEQVKYGADAPERESPLMANLYLLGEQVERLERRLLRWNLYLLGEQVERLERQVAAMERQLRPVTCQREDKMADSPPHPTPPRSEANLRIEMITEQLSRHIDKIRIILDACEV